MRGALRVPLRSVGHAPLLRVDGGRRPAGCDARHRGGCAASGTGRWPDAAAGRMDRLESAPAESGLRAVTRDTAEAGST
jgi:hypothetical protein